MANGREDFPGFPNYPATMWRTGPMQPLLSLRDHFAGLAMEMIFDPSDEDQTLPEVARDAYRLADEMIAARNVDANKPAQ